MKYTYLTPVTLVSASLLWATTVFPARAATWPGVDQPSTVTVPTSVATSSLLWTKSRFDPSKGWSWSPWESLDNASNRAVAPGDFAALHAASGLAGARFYWTLNGDLIPGATNDVLILTNSHAADGGAFRLVAVGAGGVVQSIATEVVVDSPILPFSDRFADAGALHGAWGSGHASNRDATHESDEPSHAGKKGARSIWVRWVAPSGGVVTFDTQGSTFDTVLAVYTGESLATLSPVASDDDSAGYHSSRVRFNAMSGVVYRVAVDSFGTDGGEVVLNWGLDPASAPLPVILSGPSDVSAMPGSSVKLSVEYSHPKPVSFQWYYFDKPIVGAQAQDLVIKSVDSTSVGLYSVRLVSGSEVVWSRPADVQVNSLGLSGVFARNKLGDASTSGIRSAGMLQDNGAAVSGATPVSKPLRTRLGGAAMATPPVGSKQFTIGFVTAPSKEPDEPNPCGEVGGASSWLFYDCPANGVLSVDLAGSAFDTVLGVYVDDGRALGFGSLVGIACDNNSGTNGYTSRVSFPAFAGTNYAFMVDGVGGAYGYVSFALCLNEAPAISAISAQTIVEDQSTSALAFTVGDVETASSNLVVTASSSNQYLVPTSSITLGGASTNRTITVHPPLYRSGAAWMTLTVTDAEGAAASTSFLLTVTDINHAPIARNDLVTRTGSTLNIPMGSLLSNDSDADGDTLTLVSFTSPGTAGGTITQSGSNLVYSASTTNVADYFTYRISDGHGQTNSAIVTVNVPSGQGGGSE